MRLYNNIWMSISYLFGVSAKNSKNKLQNAIDKRDDRKELESSIQYLSGDEKEHKRRVERAEKREKRATRSLLMSFLGIFLLFIFMFFPNVLIIAIVGALISIPSILYGLWYSLWGKYL